MLKLLTLCTSYREIEKRGVTEEGIYRISGILGEIRQLKSAFDECKFFQISTRLGTDRIFGYFQYQPTIRLLPFPALLSGPVRFTTYLAG